MAALLNKLREAKFSSAAQYLLTVIFSTLSFISCASSYDYSEQEKTSTSSYTFYDYKDGEKVQYKVYFNDDDISTLYINGKQVLGDEVNKHRNMIYDRLDNVSQGSVSRFKNNAYVNMDWLNEMMSNLKENLKENQIHINFDKKKLEKDMKQLREELKNIDVDINFDKEQFKREMKKLKKHLREMKYEDFDFDMEEFNEKMQEFSEKMKDHKIVMKDFRVTVPPIHIPHIVIPEIPEIPDINIDLSELEESMKNLDKNMAELDKEMIILDAFMSDFKKELVKDGTIEDEDDRIEINYHSDGLEINGEKIPDHLYEKYKKLYKEHFGKEFDPHFRIRIND